MSGSSTIPTPTTPDVCTYTILVDGTEIPNQYHLLAIVVDKELGRIPKAVLQFRDGEASSATFELSNTDLFIPGKKVEIQLGYGAQNETVFKGIVIKHSLKVRQNGSFLQVECRHEVIKMTQSKKSHYFFEKKDSDIFEELLSNYGLQYDVEATSLSWKEIVQYQASDWDFMMCRAEANAKLVMVDDDKVNISSPNLSNSAVLNIVYGATLLELDLEMDARWQPKSISTTSWNATDQALISASAQEPTLSTIGNLATSDLSKVLDDQEQVIRHEGKLEQVELDNWANALLQRKRLAKSRGRARFQGFAGIKPGQTLDLSGIGDRFTGTFLISGVRHQLMSGQWETDVQLGLAPQIFVETFDLNPLPAAGLLPGVSGLQIGVVAALENDPEGEDRIRVKLPLVGLDEDGVWARIATLDAGQDRGTFFRPEIGDEVVVGFLGNDPRHPIVLGMCHSSAKPNPEPAKDDNHLKGYVSREKLKLSFDDEKKIIALETPGGNSISLSEDAKGITLQDQNGNKIILNDSGIQIESSKDLSIKATKDIKLEGANIEVKAQTGFKAEGAASAEISAANATLKGSAMTVIQGGLVQIN